MPAPTLQREGNTNVDPHQWTIAPIRRDVPPRAPTEDCWVTSRIVLYCLNNTLSPLHSLPPLPHLAPKQMERPKMATQTETKLKLEAPEAVQTVEPADAAGLVPIEEGVKSKLETVVDKFVAELVAADANSPEFGKKVDELTNMGRKQIM